MLGAAAAACVSVRARACRTNGARPRWTSRTRHQVVASPGGSTALPVLVATGYVVARHSSDVGVKTGGRLASLKFEEGTRVRKGEVIAEIEHADIDGAARGRAPRRRGSRSAAGADARAARRGSPQRGSAARAGEGRHHDRCRRSPRRKSAAAGVVGRA